MTTNTETSKNTGHDLLIKGFWKAIEEPHTGNSYSQFKKMIRLEQTQFRISENRFVEKETVNKIATIVLYLDRSPVTLEKLRKCLSRFRDVISGQVHFLWKKETGHKCPRISLEVEYTSDDRHTITV